MEISPIAYYSSVLKTKFGVPRQSGVIPDLEGRLVFKFPYNHPDYFKGIEEYDYLWIIWGFSDNKPNTAKKTVRPPLLGGNKRMGVFATRSPFRPTPLGLSSVKIKRVEINKETVIIHVCGGDLRDGTPIYDIKPYLEYTDSHQNIRNGFTDKVKWSQLKVTFSENASLTYSDDEKYLITKILEQDPRPHYQNNPDKVYGIIVEDKDIHFIVRESTCIVL